MTGKLCMMEQNSFAPEWFDFDRMVKVMPDEGETPEVDASPDYEPGTDLFGWEGCPKCKSMNVVFIGEESRDDKKVSSVWLCNDCKHSFLEKNWIW